MLIQLDPICSLCFLFSLIFLGVQIDLGSSLSYYSLSFPHRCAPAESSTLVFLIICPYGQFLHLPMSAFLFFALASYDIIDWHQLNVAISSYRVLLLAVWAGSKILLAHR